MKNQYIYNLLVIFLLLIICLLIGAIYIQSKKSAIHPLKIIKNNFVSNTNRTKHDNFLRLKSMNETTKATNNHNAKIYYIDHTKGNNKNSGLRVNQAWKDFSNINKIIFTKGDTILLKKGEIWNKTLFTPSGGNEKKPIFIGAYGNGPLPVIDVKNKYPSAIRIYHSYISINNLKIKNSTNDCLSIAITGGLKDIILKNIVILNAGNNGIGVTKGGSNLTISGCYIENAQNNGIYLGGSAKNKLSKVIVRDCHIKTTSTNDGITIHEDDMGNTAGSNFLLKNNISEMCAEQGFDITSGKNVLLLDNISYNNKQGGILIDHSAQYITIKGHISTDEPVQETSAAINLAGKSGNIRLFKSIIKGNGYHLLLIKTNNIVICNNDFVWSGGNSPIDISGKIKNLYFMNNIIYSKQYKMNRIRFLEISRPPDYSNFYFDYNLYYVPDNNIIFYYNGKNYNFREYKKIFKIEKHSKDIDPEFLEPFNDKYQLKNISKAIDKGCFYTHPVAKGMGKNVTVKNSLFFYKIFNPGDYQCIMFKGLNEKFNVLDVNYDTNTISLNKKINYDPANAIGICYKKKIMDIGAYEFGN